MSNCWCNEQSPSTAIPLQAERTDCGTCWPISGYPLPESFYEWAKLLTPIAKAKLPPFDVKVSKLPHSDYGILTISDNEIVWYKYDKGITYTDVNGVLIPYGQNNPWDAGTITIIKRWLHPTWTFNGNDGKGGSYVDVSENGVMKRYDADYNNCNYMFSHGTNDSVSADITHLTLRLFASSTCCRPATNKDLWIVAIEWPICASDVFPVVPSICLYANCGRRGIVRDVTKCMPDGSEMLVSYNDYATPTRPWLVKITDTRIVDCQTGDVTVITPTGDIPETALNASQIGYKGIRGSVSLSHNWSGGEAHSSNHYANSTSAGIILTREIMQTFYDIPADIQRNGYPLLPCGNQPVRAITDKDLADESIEGLAKLSRPCDWNTTNNIALNKFDTATPTNLGSVMLSRESCTPCSPIAVGDNDLRLFKPYIQLLDTEIGWTGSIFTTDWVWTTQVEFLYWYTNIYPNSEPLNCGMKDSVYYGFTRDPSELFTDGTVNFYKSIIIPKDGMYHASWQCRLFVDLYIDSNIPFGNARWRLKVNSDNTTLGDKKEWIHRSFKQDIVDNLNASAWTSWIKPWTEYVNWDPAASDSFLQAEWDIYLFEWDEVWLEIDMDLDTTLDYRYYRQRIHLHYIDETQLFV